jgi:hypothetical protein
MISGEILLHNSQFHYDYLQIPPVTRQKASHIELSIHGVNRYANQARIL